MHGGLNMLNKSLQEQLEKKLQYSFSNVEHLQIALTHKSYTVDDNRNKENNERLEFLGDSILNFVVAEKLLGLFPEANEGVLSKKRASLVNLNKLAEIAKKFDLQDYMFFGPGEVKQGNHLNARIQGSCVESLIGAIYQDAGFEKARLWTLAQYSNEDFYEEVNASFAADFKTRLQELTQKYKLGTPVYELVLSTGPSHKPKFLVSLKLNNIEKSRGEGPSKKSAEQNAAELYLNELVKTLKES